MPQTQTTIPIKDIGEELSSTEFNSLNSIVNQNSVDIENRLSASEIDNSNLDIRVSAAEIAASNIQLFSHENLPTTADNGTIVLDTTNLVPLYHNNGKWYKISDDKEFEIIVVVGFTFKVKTDNTGTSNPDQFTLPLISGNTYNFEVTWEDGVTQTVTSDVPVTHTFSGGAGTYEVSITGIIQGLHFNNSGDADKLIEVSNWGDLSFGSDAEDAFYGCNNLVNIATDAPDTSTTSDFLWFFYKCSALTNVPALDLSSGDRYFAMFRGCSNVVTMPDLDFSSGTNSTKFRETFRNMTLLTTLDNCIFGDSRGDIRLLFRDCTSLLNVPPSLDTTNCTNMQQTFYNCSSLTSIPALNTSRVTNFGRAWQGCSGLTSFPQLDFSSGENIGNAWRECTSLADFPVLDFSSATSFDFTWADCALNSASIDNIMSALVASGKSGLSTSLAGGTTIPLSSWSAQAQADHATLVSNGWTITTN